MSFVVGEYIFLGERSPDHDWQAGIASVHDGKMLESATPSLEYERTRRYIESLLAAHVQRTQSV